MATRKSAPRKGGKAASSSAAAKRSSITPVPPYGEAIRDALVRGDAAEMKRVAASARKYLSNVQAALDKLDKSLGKK